MSLLEVPKCLVILHKTIELRGLTAGWGLPGRERFEVSEDLRGRVKLDSAACTLLVPLQDHVRDYFQLCDPLEL